MNKLIKKLSRSALLLVPLLGINSNAEEKTANSLASAQHEPMLVTVDWLGDHLSDPSLVLLQIGEKKDYDKGHIPGAQFLEYESISTPHGRGLMLELPPVEIVKDLAAELVLGRRVDHAGRTEVHRLFRRASRECDDERRQHRHPGDGCENSREKLHPVRYLA